MSITHRNGKHIVQVYDRGLGRMRQVGTYPTQRAAKKAEAEAKAATHVPNHESVAEWRDRWLILFPRPKESSTRVLKEKTKAFSAKHGRLPLNGVTKAMAREWAIQHPSHTPGLRAMWNDARRVDLVDTNPFERLGLAGPGKRHLDPDWLTLEQVHDLADTGLRVHGSWGPVMRAMVLFAAYTGVRFGELVALEWPDLGADTVTVRRQADSKAKITTSPKSGKARIIAYPSAAREAVERMPVMAEQVTVFAAPRGGRLWQPNFSVYWKATRAAFGRPDMKWHELRHLCATHLLALGLAPHEVAAQLGHQDGGALVMSTYGHPSEKAARARVLQAFDGVDELKARRAGA